MITEATIAHQVQSPWSVLRRVEWVDVRELDEMFRSERLGGPHGQYFDERFATGVHDPLKAKAILVQQEKEAIALVFCSPPSRTYGRGWRSASWCRA